LLDEDVSTALLIVRDPMALQFAPTSRAAFHADRVRLSGPVPRL
jgi:hypothetical protein